MHYIISLPRVVTSLCALISSHWSLFVALLSLFVALLHKSYLLCVTRSDPVTEVLSFVVLMLLDMAMMNVSLKAPLGIKHFKACAAPRFKVYLKSVLLEVWSLHKVGAAPRIGVYMKYKLLRGLEFT